MKHWIEQAVIYHIYPLGCVDAPERNDFSLNSVPRLEQLYGWLDHMQGLGANTLYLGPVFESSAHGYDTADYYHVDRRLGTDETLQAFSAELHRRGMRLVLDGVFNHVGRDFWAFRDVLQNRETSRFTAWFHNLRFDQVSPYGDPFSYEGWSGNYDLVKLNLKHPEVRSHLLEAVATWMDLFQIDGLRLDATDCLDFDFLAELSAFCRARKPDFWLMGEVVHGDYTRWAKPPSMLDSVTNYECYKGLYSSLADSNYFEIAYALNRQFGPNGLYRNLGLYNFVDNHDVNRVASQLKDQRHLYPLYLMLFTMPGVPSIYYGSEWGLTGQRDKHSDRGLRPALQPGQFPANAPQPALPETVSQLAQIRANLPALQSGQYRQVLVKHQQMAFSRKLDGQEVLVVFNAEELPVKLSLPLEVSSGSTWVDALNGTEHFLAQNNCLNLEVPPFWGRILVRE